MSVIWPLSKLFARAPASVENRSQYEQCLLYTYSIIYHTDGWQRHRNTRDDNTAPCQQKWMQFFRVPHSFECGNFIAKYKNHESTQSAAAVEAGSGSVYFPERTDGRVNSGHAECYTLFTAQIAQGTKSSFFLFSHHSAKWRRIILVFCFSCRFVQCALIRYGICKYIDGLGRRGRTTSPAATSRTDAHCFCGWLCWSEKQLLSVLIQQSLLRQPMDGSSRVEPCGKIFILWSRFDEMVRKWVFYAMLIESNWKIKILHHIISTV